MYFLFAAGLAALLDRLGWNRTGAFLEILTCVADRVFITYAFGLGVVLRFMIPVYLPRGRSFLRGGVDRDVKETKCLSANSESAINLSVIAAEMSCNRLTLEVRGKTNVHIGSPPFCSDNCLLV